MRSLIDNWRLAKRGTYGGQSGFLLTRWLCTLIFSALWLTGFSLFAFAQAPQPPATPIGLTAQASATTANLTWTPVTGATTYNLYRSTTAGGEGTTPFLTGLPASPAAYADTGLAISANYYYKIAAVGPGGQSGQSPEAHAQTVPAPATATVHPGDTQLTVSWPALGAATGYKVYRSTAPGAEGSTPYRTLPYNFADFTDTGLTNSTVTYYYQVTNLIGNNESARSPEVSGTPLPPPPLAPTGLNATPGNGQIALSWTASANATSYNIYRAATSGTETAPALTTVTTTTYTDTGLTNGVPENYVVTAVNTGGESAFSNEQRTYPNGPAAPPSGLLAFGGNGQVSLSWGNVTGATSYNVRRSLSSGGPWGSPVSVTKLAGSLITAVGYVDTGLTNGTTYYYQVTSVNNTTNTAAESGPSSASATPGAPPSASSSLTAHGTTGSIGLSWTAVSGCTYNVYRSQIVAGSELAQPLVTGLSSPSYTDNAPGLQSWYQVTAVGTGGLESAKSSEVTASSLASPTGLSAQSGNTQMSLSWNLVAGSSAYNLYRSTTSGGGGEHGLQAGDPRDLPGDGPDQRNDVLLQADGDCDQQ